MIKIYSYDHLISLKGEPPFQMYYYINFLYEEATYCRNLIVEKFSKEDHVRGYGMSIRINDLEGIHQVVFYKDGSFRICPHSYLLTETEYINLLLLST